MAAPSHSLLSHIVRVHDVNGTCRGAGLRLSETQICTCAHVIAACLSVRSAAGTSGIQVSSCEGPALVGAVNERSSPPRDDGGDVALIRTTKPLRNARPPTCSATSISVGHPFEAMGFPHGFHVMGAFTRGKFGNVNVNGWVELLAADGSGFRVQRGFSGAPVWDVVRCAVVGLIVGVDTDRSSGVGFLIPLAVVQRELQFPPSFEQLPTRPHFTSAFMSSYVSSMASEDRRDHAVRFLASCLAELDDPEEQYWVIIGIGRLGGRVASETLSQLSDIIVDRYIRLALTEAIQTCNK